MCQDSTKKILHPSSSGDLVVAHDRPADRAALLGMVMSSLPPGQFILKTGSRRRRLWDLSDHAHCPVIGVCLPMAVVRRLATKVHGSGKRELDDYDSHCMAVTESKRRTALAELIQKELDQRYALAIKEAGQFKSEEALLSWWLKQVEGPGLAPAFWVTLTHPYCSDAVEYKVLGHVHMLQHQVGSACRVERAQFERLMHENAVLGRQLAKAQDRITLMASGHATRVDQLERSLVQTRADLISRETEVADLKDKLARLQAAAPELPTRLQLAQHVHELTSQNQSLRREHFQAQEAVERLELRVKELTVQPFSADLPPAAEARDVPIAGLINRSILCVGGRAASVPIYRELIEHEGGRFLHHDGGEENSAAQLDATLAAADLVICQTGCVSHNAYWRVKDHCKRTGKQCVFVDTPSRSALSRALIQITQGRAHAGEQPICIKPEK